jgi:hypothetical protein
MCTGCGTTGKAAGKTDELQTLRDCIAATRDRKHAHKYRTILRESRAFLAEVKPDATAANLSAERKAALADLLERFRPLVAALNKWDPHQYTLAKVREIRRANRTRAERDALWRKYATDCKAKDIQPKPRAEWAKRWPTRVLFRQDFEGPPTEAHDWEGTIVTDNVPQGSTRALLGATGSKWFGRRIRVGMYYDYPRATTQNWVRFKYFINKPVPVTVFVFDLTLRNNWETRIEKPFVGRWTEVTLNLADFREKGRRRRRIQPGDALDDVFVFAGKPGDENLKLLVDDVTVIGRD